MGAALDRRFDIPVAIAEPFRSALVHALPAWAALLERRLVSLVLFGSVACGAARESSDIDLLIVAEGFPHGLAERRAPLAALWQELRARGVVGAVEWDLVTKTPEEARFHSPLYLDLVSDAILLYDRDRFFEQILQSMRERMRELGSRRVSLPDGSWYWDLKPDYRFGECVEI